MTIDFVDTSVELIQTTAQDVVSVTEEVTSIVELRDEEVLVVEEDVIELVTVGEQGPPGPAGSTEEEVPYSKRTDFASDTVLYKGKAAPGSADDAPVWQITRITFAEDGDVDERLANGSAAFNQAWVDRATLNYV